MLFSQFPCERKIDLEIKLYIIFNFQVETEIRPVLSVVSH